MDASSAADRSQLSLLSTLSIARCFPEPPHFRIADGIASVPAGGIVAEKVVEGQCSRDAVALTHVATLDLRTGSQQRGVNLVNRLSAHRSSCSCNFVVVSHSVNKARYRTIALD